MEAYEGAEWVRISDDVPVDEDALGEYARELPDALSPGAAGSVSETALEQGDERGRRREDGRTPDGKTERGEGWPITGSSTRDDAPDWMAGVRGLRRDAVLHRRPGQRGGRLHVARDAARNGRQGLVRAPPQGSGGGLLRRQRHRPVQAGRRGGRGRAPHGRARSHRRLPLRPQRRPRRGELVICAKRADRRRGRGPTSSTSSGPRTDAPGRRRGARLHAAGPGREGGLPLRPPRADRGALLLSPRGHSRLHDPGLRGARSRGRVRQGRGARVGVSPDPVEAVRRFADKFDLAFTLLADEDHAFAEAYGTWVEKRTTGRRTGACSGRPSSSIRRAGSPGSSPRSRRRRTTTWCSKHCGPG